LIGSKQISGVTLDTLQCFESPMGNTTLRSSNKNNKHTTQQLPHLPIEIWALIFKKLTVSQLLKYENVSF
jgi:hypothetical protein